MPPWHDIRAIRLLAPQTTYQGMPYRRELLSRLGWLSASASSSQRDSFMRVLSGRACSDHSGKNRAWDFLFVSRFQGNDIWRPTWMCGISSDLVEIGPRHPCSAPFLPGMPAWFGHSRVVSEDFKTSLIDWSGRIFLISHNATTAHGTS